VLKHIPKHFGKHGFTRPLEVRREISAINVGELDERLDELLRQGIAKREEERIVIDVGKLGFERVLGGGRVTHSIEVIAKEFVESAKRKLEEAGGKAIAGEGDATA
jgi:large subunit ribosomal protein L15